MKEERRGARRSSARIGKSAYRSLTRTARTRALAVLEHQPEDDLLAERWLYGRPEETQRAYRRDLAKFRVVVRQPLRAVTLADLQSFADALGEQGLAPSSKARTLAAIKGLLSFGHRLGLLRFDVGRALRVPQARSRLSERILSEADTHRLLAFADNARNRALLRLLYAAGLRVSEAAGLRWRDLQPRDDAGQCTVLGKGNRVRAILLPHSVWIDLYDLRADAADEDPVFRSRRGRPLSVAQIRRVVAAAARRAGLKARVSPHFLRHAHASHALDRGAPLHLVQATLGHASIATTGVYAHARPSASSSQYLAL